MSEGLGVTDRHWQLLAPYRLVAQYAYETEILTKAERISGYDQAIAAARESFAGRGINLEDPAQVYLACISMMWAVDFMVNLTASKCNDPHVFEHLREATLWPTLIVGAITRDVPLTFPEEEDDGILPEV
jgi:hypothetical protein